MVCRPQVCARLILSMLVLGLSVIMFGCQKQLPESRAVTLKIAGVMPFFFEAQHGNVIQTEHYDITLEFVPYELMPRDGSSADNLNHLYTIFQPDVVNWAGSLRPLIDQGLLASLDAYMLKEGFDRSGIPEILMNRITAEGSDEIYAIPSRFSTQALFYNVSMLAPYGIEISDSAPLTWDQLFQLAAAVPPEDGQGNANIRFLRNGEDEASKLFSLIRTAALAENLQAINKENGSVHVNSDNWRQLWTTFIDAFNQRLINSSEDTKPFYEDEGDDQRLDMDVIRGFKPFIEGRAAFVLGHPGLLYHLNEEAPGFEWGIAPQPGSFQVFTQLSESLLINPSSEHKDAAWELISYLTGVEQTNRSILSKPGEATHLFSRLPMQRNLLERHLNMSLAPFYSQPSSFEGFFDASPLPDELSIAYYEDSLSLINEVLQGTLSIDTALEQLQSMLELKSAELFGGR